MKKSLYRYTAITSNTIKDGRVVKFCIHPDIFFDDEKDAISFGDTCTYCLERSPSGIVKLITRDCNGKIVARIKRNDITKYECRILQKEEADTYLADNTKIFGTCTLSFEEIWNLIDHTECGKCLYLDNTGATVDKFEIRN